MPRPLRIEFEGAWYHVMNRGAGRQAIYKSAEHRDLFLNLLNQACSYYKIELHAYCLMDNHYHLLIHTPRANLSQAMRHVNGLYTQQFNRLEKTDGPLFRGRYKSILIDKDAYLLQVSRYIHLNPSSAGIMNAENYQWSSYQYYIGKELSPNWLQTSYISAMISHKNKKDAYRLFVNEGIDKDTERFYSSKNHLAIFGDPTFKTQVLRPLKKKKIQDSKPDYNRTRITPSISQISKACSSYFKVNEDELLHYQRGKINMPRKIAMYLCRSLGHVTLQEISFFFKCKTKSGASNAVSTINQYLIENADVKKQIKQIEKILKD